MRKSLCFIVTLIAMVLSVPMLSSCGEEIYAVVVRAESGIGADEYHVTAETKDALLASRNRMDARLNKIFGKTFEVECPPDELPSSEDFIPYCKRIRNDDVIKRELEYLSNVETVDGKPAVSYVVFYFYTGDHELAKYLIEME